MRALSIMENLASKGITAFKQEHISSGAIATRKLIAPLITLASTGVAEEMTFHLVILQVQIARPINANVVNFVQMRWMLVSPYSPLVALVNLIEMINVTLRLTSATLPILLVAV
jgi:hypothetical protein